MNLKIENNVEKTKESKEVQELINELSESLENEENNDLEESENEDLQKTESKRNNSKKNKKSEETKDLSESKDVEENQEIEENLDDSKNSELIENLNNSEKYAKYWKYRLYLEGDVAANIGISRIAANEYYANEISDTINESIMELTESEGTLYRSQGRSSNVEGNLVYTVEKYEDSEITSERILVEDFPSGYSMKDIIFQYNDDGEIVVREDLTEEILQSAIEKCAYLKQLENEKAQNFKVEGETYEAIEGEEYIFLENSGGDRIEDIDFIVDNYEGEGTYQVIDGEYKKVDDVESTTVEETQIDEEKEDN